MITRRPDGGAWDIKPDQVDITVVLIKVFDFMDVSIEFEFLQALGLGAHLQIQRLILRGLVVAVSDIVLDLG